MLEITQHALDRWQERFPELDIHLEYACTKRCGPRMRKRVKQSCPEHVKFCDRQFRGRYLVSTKEGIVFVMAYPEIIITVLDFRRRQ